MLTKLTVATFILFHVRNSKVNEELDKKKVWIDEQIEKILSRQKDISLLEAELRDRDISLKKKEALLKEKDFLEIKKSKSSVNLSKVNKH